MGTKGTVSSLATVFRRPRYAAAAIVLSIAYYFTIIYIIRYQNYNILLLNVPLYEIYALAVLSSILVVVSVFSLNNTTRSKNRYSGASIGSIATFMGGIVNGCGCSAPILFGLTYVGASAASVISLTNTISAWSKYIFAAMMLIDIALLLYYMRRIANPSCSVV